MDTPDSQTTGHAAGGLNILQQRGKFDVFIEEFNNERPHEVLDMKCPTEIPAASGRVYTGTPGAASPVP
jgi:hypothetical protein